MSASQITSNQNRSSASNKLPLKLISLEGQLQIYSSQHRGSISTVFSEALRSAGLGSKVLISQFLKGGVLQGPENALNLCGGLEWMRPSISKCISGSVNLEDDLESINAVSALWDICKDKILLNKVDKIVLDEIGLAIKFGFIQEEDFISTLLERPTSIDVIITGQSIPSKIISIADQVTQLRCFK